MSCYFDFKRDFYSDERGARAFAEHLVACGIEDVVISSFNVYTGQPWYTVCWNENED